jgi:IPT/TIG domain
VKQVLSVFASLLTVSLIPVAARTAMVLVGLSLGLAGCNDLPASSGPAAPSPVPQAAPQPAPRPAPQPAPSPTGPQPTVTAITPNAGSTGGGAWGTITGAQFQPGATVKLGDGGVQQTSVQDEATILFWTTNHSAGTVDVVVTNPGGLSGRLADAYTFSRPESFDFNGDWVAHAGPEYETDMRFSIRDNVLVSLACGSSKAVPLSPPLSVYNGGFSFLGDGGIAISGRVVSSVNSLGTISVPGCTDARWWADKSTAVQRARAR